MTAIRCIRLSPGDVLALQRGTVLTMPWDDELVSPFGDRLEDGGVYLAAEDEESAFAPNTVWVKVETTRAGRRTLQRTDPPPPETATRAGCVFCSPEPDRVFIETDEFVVIWSKFEVALGHALILPRRHVADPFDFNTLEARKWHGLLPRIVGRIQNEYRNAGLAAPDGYNVGWNAGTAAGQTVMHAHIHVIPRVAGDVADPRGGVRNVIPAKGNYLAGATTPCTLPPPGWACSRGSGHTGPCAASPVEQRGPGIVVPTADERLAALQAKVDAWDRAMVDIETSYIYDPSRMNTYHEATKALRAAASGPSPVMGAYTQVKAEAPARPFMCYQVPGVMVAFGKIYVDGSDKPFATMAEAKAFLDAKLDADRRDDG